MKTTNKSPIHAYLNKLTNSILNIKFKNDDLLTNPDLLANYCKILLDENDTSLLKHQLQKLASIGINNITQNQNAFSIDYENFYTDFISCDFLYKSNDLQKK